jgi:ribosomal protein L11 methyltransferase
MSGEGVSWKVSLPCTKAEAEALPGEVAAFADYDEPPVLMTSEPDETKPDEWRLDAYFPAEPTPEEVAVLRGLTPSAAGIPPAIERLGDEDWLTMSQQGLEPIRAGRFFVHTPAHRDAVPAGAIAFQIDAGRAFGTGQHETTAGCLEALDRLKESGLSFANLADIGTGTGLLAFAALRLWPGAKAIASDIDPISIEVTEENAAINRLTLGAGAGELELVVADGMEQSRLKARAPYDLLIANILAGPLIDLAPDFAKAIAPGGRIVLAGLLAAQAEAVASAYRRQGFAGIFAIERGDWTILAMRKRRATGWQ